MINKVHNDAALQVAAPLINDYKYLSFVTNFYNNIDNNKLMQKIKFIINNI